MKTAGALPASFCLLLLALPGATQAADGGPAAVVERAIADAEAFLRAGEAEAADSAYRRALVDGWLLRGSLHAADQRWPEARRAFERAAASAVEVRRPLQALALVHLQTGDAAAAVDALTRVVALAPRDVEARRLLAQAHVANGRPEQAVQELEEARAAAPDDLELAFLLASAYLRVKKPEAAEPLFAHLLRERPLPQTRVLIGHAYRGFGEYDRARRELRAALRQDPRARRAHYDLGMVAVLDQGVTGLDEAIAEFQAELALDADDAPATLSLGMALVEAQRSAEALPLLERAAARTPPHPNAFQYLGRCLLALERPGDAVAPLERALTLAAGDALLASSVEYQLGLAYRGIGDVDQAGRHFGAAERSSAERAQTARERLVRYLAGDRTRDAAPPASDSPLTVLTAAQREQLGRSTSSALARAYLNLGILHAQGQRIARAAELFAQAAEVDADFPQVQYSLGVALFNTGRFADAAAPLSRALARKPGDPELSRMLAMAWLNSESYQQAADLLARDPSRESDPSLQFAYGMALVRSGHAADAQPIFARLLTAHGESAELAVVVGQAHAQQGDYPSAIAALTRALSLKADVADANAALGLIYLKQGRLPEAEAALHAELVAHPSDVTARHTLATVLDLLGRPGEAVQELRAVLKARPQFADARYLLGKILLAQGEAAEAAEHLEAAARTAPEDANIRYQLGQAYTKLGRADLAQEQFDLFRRLKDRSRGSAP